MVRSARVKSESNIYHIMIRGINRQLIAVDEEDNQKMKEILEQCKEICGYELYGYCFLGNHIHLLMKEGGLSTLNRTTFIRSIAGIELELSN